MEQIERRWKYNEAIPDKSFMLSDLATDNRWYLQRLEEFESKLAVATRFKTEEEFIGEEIQRIGKLFTKPIQISSPGMRNPINYTEYVRQGYDLLSMGQDWPLQNIVGNAKANFADSIDASRTPEFSEAVYDNLQDGVAWLMYENFLKKRLLSKLNKSAPGGDNNVHSIFLSYCWADKVLADQIEQDLKQIGIRIIRDKNELEYKDSIEKFMARVREVDFVIVLFSDDYLRSKNCLHELFDLLKEKEFEHKILPILSGDCKFFTAQQRLPFLQYWEKKRDELQVALSQVDILTSPSLQEELRFATQVCLQLDQHLTKLADMNHLSFEQMRSENYRSLIQKIGGTEIGHLFELLEITLIPDPQKREIALDNYFEKYPPNTYSYALRGALAKEQGNFERSKTSYEKAIALAPTNAEALNNLGFLYLKDFKDPVNAKIFFEKAIAANPNLTIAKLNLATTLSGNKDTANAEKLYKEILTARPNEIKALNNLANIYSNRGDYQQARLLFEKVLDINPDFYESLVNLASIINVHYNDPDKALTYFQRAKQIAPDEGERKLAEVMIESINKQQTQSPAPSTDKKPGRNAPCPCGSGLKFKRCHGK